MRVLQITAFSGWGCTGRIAVGIYNALTAQEHECAIAWGRMNTVSDHIHTIQIGNGIDQKMHGLYTRITDKCGFGSKGVTNDFIKKLAEYQPNLIQLHILHGYYINLEILFSYIKKHHIPIVWTFHDCWAFTGHCPYFDLADCGKWKTGCYDCQCKQHHPKSWLLDNSKWNWERKRELFTDIENLTVVTPSEWLAGLVKQSFLKECRVKVINNGINLNDFQPMEGCFKKHNGLVNKKIVLGVSSSWAKSKGLDDFAVLSKMLPDNFVIVLVGLTNRQKYNLPKTMVKIGRTDSVQQLAEIYTAATVFVNPTYEDNYPTTNLEALACGTPVVTYETGGSVEAVEQSGYGERVEQGNVKALCESILRVVKTVSDEKLGLYKCDEVANYKKYVELYKEISIKL